jgi:hypothetical protein
VLKIWGNVGTRASAQTAAVSDPKFFRASSSGLLSGGVGIAPQQCALGARRMDTRTIDLSKFNDVHLVRRFLKQYHG